MKMGQALVNLGHQVHLIAPRNATKSKLSWVSLKEHYGLRCQFPITWLPSYALLRRYDYACWAVRLAYHLKADLLYTRLPQAAALASLWGFPTVFEVHDLPQGRIGPTLLKLFLKGRGARRLVLITQALASDLASCFGPLPPPPFTHLAPDGVDLERYTRLPEPEEARRALLSQNPLLSKHLDPQRFTVGYTGHFYPGRGLSLILDIAHHLPDFTFLLVGGEPPDVERFRRQVLAQGLRNVAVVGFVSNQSLPLYQAACEVLLMPYQQNVAASSGGDIARYLSPMKTFEYLACGRAILSSDLPVLKEVLTDGTNALLLPPDDLEAWILALQKLHKDPGLRHKLGEQARQKAKAYSWERRAAGIFGFSEDTAFQQSLEE